MAPLIFYYTYYICMYVNNCELQYMNECVVGVRVSQSHCAASKINKNRNYLIEEIFLGRVVCNFFKG